MFWGVQVKATPKTSHPLEYQFSESVKISQVVLEPPMSSAKQGKVGTPNGKSKKDKNLSLAESPTSATDGQKQSLVSLMVDHDGKQFMLCTLDPSHSWQCPLDLVFQAGTTVKFSLRGHGTLHLTGYEIPDEMDDDDDDQMISFDEESDEELDDDDDEEPMEVNVKAKPDKNKKAVVKGKNGHTNGVAKASDLKRKAKPTGQVLMDDQDDDESSDDLDFEADSDEDEESEMDEDDAADDFDVSSDDDE